MMNKNKRLLPIAKDSVGGIAKLESGCWQIEFCPFIR